jgi:predicted nucleic acid-binding protein
MARETFVDTSGFYALLVKRDKRHLEAVGYLHAHRAKQRRFVTTDYVLGESATLLKARGHAHLLSRFFDIVMASAACAIHWTDVESFEAARRLFLKHLDHKWSFTDCVSFTAMRQLRVTDALTTDDHFKEAGFVALLC